MRSNVARAHCVPSSPAHGAAPSARGSLGRRVEIPGAGLPLVVDLARTSAGAWTGSIVIPGLGIKGAPLANLVVTDDQVSFDLGSMLGTPLGAANSRGKPPRPTG
jgi:hypothetical protein